MTIEEIRANAPSDATHYWDYPASVFPIDYFKKDGDNICVWADWLEKPDWLPNEKLKGYEFKPL